MMYSARATCACGTQILDGDAFCQTCGKPVPTDFVDDREICPECSFKQQQKGRKVCFKCGAPLVKSAAPAAAAAVVQKPQETIAPVPAIVYEEPSTVFALGLPKWSIEPPEVVVRRKARI